MTNVRKRTVVRLALMAMLAYVGIASATPTRTWNLAGPSTGSWHVASNWLPEGVPENGEVIAIANPATWIQLTNATADLLSFEMTNSATLVFSNMEAL